MDAVYASCFSLFYETKNEVGEENFSWGQVGTRGEKNIKQKKIFYTFSMGPVGI
jgi:hypothetical protein